LLNLQQINHDKGKRVRDVASDSDVMPIKIGARYFENIAHDTVDSVRRSSGLVQANQRSQSPHYFRRALYLCYGLSSRFDC
jgi:hypothetical protein